ncbi:MAG: hypothetical protein QOJ29_1858 [Thermoleophilaceae bacterium]|jgi:hypothetical protein|nr:hypothetical protein [Thermoleophilaceae bacterium]
MEGKPSATPAAPPDVRSARRDLLVAAIAALAAILGAGAGGFAAYLGNRSLEDSKSEAVARGAARVLQAQFRSVDVRLTAMLDRGRLYPVDEAFNIGRSDDDQQAIAGTSLATSGNVWRLRCRRFVCTPHSTTRTL